VSGNLEDQEQLRYGNFVALQNPSIRFCKELLVESQERLAVQNRQQRLPFLEEEV